MGFEPVECPGNCVYLGKINGEGQMCAYLLITGQRRGCDPGPGCKRYVGKKRRGFKARAPSWDVEKGRQMWEQGCTDAQIGRALGAAESTVRSYRRRRWGAKNTGK